MHYEIYKNARDASWRFLLQHKIRDLPIDLKCITSAMDIIVKRDETGILDVDERGKAIKANGKLRIIVCDMPIPQKRYTIMHEIGHIVLGHTESDDRSDVDEYAAERFAIGVLAPARVLWGLNIHKAEDIAELCNISITSARIREKRMQELYTRNKFLTSPIERQVFEQFSDFIKSKKQIF